MEEKRPISVDILISGAGLSGLALAYFLQISGFSGKLVVLDRESVFESARQGFSLTLQNRTRSILEEYKLLDEMYQFGSEARTQKFYTADGETLYLNEEQNVKRFNYPLPRQSIRNVCFSLLYSYFLTCRFSIRSSSPTLCNGTRMSLRLSSQSPRTSSHAPMAPSTPASFSLPAMESTARSPRQRSLSLHCTRIHILPRQLPLTLAATCKILS